MNDFPWDRRGTLEKIAERFKPDEQFDLSTANARNAISRIGSARPGSAGNGDGPVSQAPAVDVNSVVSFITRLIVGR